MMATYIPGKKDQNNTNRLSLDKPPKPRLGFAIHGTLLTQNLLTNTIQVMAPLNRSIYLDGCICDRTTHLLGDLTGKNIFPLLEDVQGAGNNILTLFKGRRLGEGAESFLRLFGDALKFGGGDLFTGDDWLVRSRGDGGNCI